ncbi:Acg family FMN-binding oxidoreductase [Nocardia asteroides]|uniref:Acg family FMN-binding oxidoreductase n=1 Tax=Nocardia asteroides TaxID=1824 RepID=UPI0037C96D53
MNDDRVHPAPDHPTVRAAIRLGCRAPSVHNTQPWRWAFDGTALLLYRDLGRQLTEADPTGRQAVISCGAVLHHVRTAFAAAHWHTEVTRFPDPDRPDLLARIEFQPWADPPMAELRRAEAIDRRYTDRLPMDAPIGLDSVLSPLDKVLAPHELSLDLLTDDVRPRLATASEQSDALRHYDMQYQAEIRWWAGHSEHSDGVPPSALPSESELARVGVARTFPTPGRSARRADSVDNARLAVLASADESPLSWLRTGEALSAVLLECTAAGLSTCALTHITELPASRRTLIGLLGHPGTPQVVLRIGIAPTGELHPPTPRRPLTEVLVEG